MAEKVTSSESTGQAEGQASDEEHSDASDEEHSDDGGGDASSTRDESIKTTDKPSRVRKPFQNPATCNPII